MKVRMAVLCSLFVCLFFVNLSPVEAQYRVQIGDTLWQLAGEKLNDPLSWEQVFAANPFLKEEGRRFVKPDGTIVVILRPGEKLEGLDRLGIMPELRPITDLQIGVSAQPEAPTVSESGWRWTAFFSWLPIFLMLVAAILAVIILLKLRKDPIRSGYPIVEGGVTEETAPAQFQTVAQTLYQERTGQSAPVNSFSVLETVRGLMYGVMTVHYADGRREARRLNGEVGYRARVRFPDGREETIYMLQACGNDLRYSGISRYVPGGSFRFEPQVEPVRTPTPVAGPRAVPPLEQAVVPVAEPVVTPGPAEVAPTAASSVPTPEEEGVIKVNFSAAHEGEDNHLLRVQGVDVDSLAFTQREGETTIRFRPKKTA